MADEFLADIESDEEDANDDAQAADALHDAEGDGDSGRDVEHGLLAGGDAAEQLQTVAERVRAELERDGPVKAVLDFVERAAAAGGPSDSSAERVTAANEVMTALGHHVDVLHRRLREVYAARFPELESLVPGAVDYARAVRIIGNEQDVASLPLGDVLPHTKVVGIAISATTTNGRPLPPRALSAVQAASDTLIELARCRQHIAAFIEARMRFLAPNVTALVGAEIAAQLVIAAGGLRQLSMLPANAVQLLGQGKLAGLSGFSSRAYLPHTGYLYHTDLVQSLPPENRMKACRVLAGKVALAARVDANIQHTRTTGGAAAATEAEDGSIGRRYREYCEAHAEKALAPLPVKVDKPLPAPDSKPKTRRGGKRLRKMKDRYAMTELRRQMNRVAMDKPEESYRDTGFGFGVLGLEGSGKVRVAAVDKGILKKVKQDAQRTSMATPGLRTSLNAARSIGTVSGMTSVAFTPTQGLELANPSAAAAPAESSLSAAVARAQATPDGYFSNINPFSSRAK